MNNFWDTFNLMQLPLSAYTPGQGDPKMEGGWETSTGAPVYTFEMWQRGEAPYVTGATSQKNPSGALVYRNVGDHNVPVKITDYGPGVEGIDIASSNKKWANNFPFQGSRDQFGAQSNTSQTPSQLPLPPATATPQTGDGLSYGQFVQQSPGLGAYASAIQPSATDRTISGLGGALSRFGSGMMQQGQQGSQQALAMLQRDPRAAAALQQFASNPLQFLANPYLQ